MRGIKESMRWENASGPPVRAGGITVTPQSQSFSLRVPFGGLVWNRPRSLIVERDGETRRIPILDVTRLVQIGFVGFAFGFWFVYAALVGRRQRREQRERANE